MPATEGFKLRPGGLGQARTRAQDSQLPFPVTHKHLFPFGTTAKLHSVSNPCGSPSPSLSVSACDSSSRAQGLNLGLCCARFCLDTFGGGVGA